MEKYELIGVIGKGNFGKISKIIRKSDQKVLIWKELDYGQMSEKEKEQIVSEVNILRELKHPNIVRYYDRIIDKKQSKIYIIMEYCEGGDLNQLIKRCKKNNEFIAEDIIWKIFTQLLLAIHAIHNHKEGKILHRDIKPSNIFLDKENNIKLGDFGLSRELSTESKFAYSHVGTPYYMSPEQIDETKYNEKSDIWSLGCFLYEITTFHPPFEAKNQLMLAMRIKSGKVEKINSRYSEELWRVITWMLNVNYEKRPSSEELLNIPQVGIRIREKRIKDTFSKLKNFEEKLNDRDKKQNEREEMLNLKENKINEKEKKLIIKENELNEKEKYLLDLEKKIKLSSSSTGYSNSRLKSSDNSESNMKNSLNGEFITNDLNNLLVYSNKNNKEENVLNIDTNILFTDNHQLSNNNRINTYTNFYKNNNTYINYLENNNLNNRNHNNFNKTETNYYNYSLNENESTTEINKLKEINTTYDNVINHKNELSENKISDKKINNISNTEINNNTNLINMNPFDVEDIKEKKKSTLSPGMTKNLSTFCSEDSLKFNICQKISPKNNNHNISMNSNLHSDNLINLSNYSSLLSQMSILNNIKITSPTGRSSNAPKINYQENFNINNSIVRNNTSTALNNCRVNNNINTNYSNIYPKKKISERKNISSLRKKNDEENLKIRNKSKGRISANKHSSKKNNSISKKADTKRASTPRMNKIHYNLNDNNNGSKYIHSSIDNKIGNDINQYYTKYVNSHNINNNLNNNYNTYTNGIINNASTNKIFYNRNNNIINNIKKQIMKGSASTKEIIKPNKLENNLIYKNKCESNSNLLKK